MSTRSSRGRARPAPSSSTRRTTGSTESARRRSRTRRVITGRSRRRSSTPSPRAGAASPCRSEQAVPGTVSAVTLERPEVDPPDGDIPFELGIDDLVVGEGDEATAGKKVTVHYVGVSFLTGEQFDASWDRGQPFEFKLGKAQVIPGWDQGVAGMRVGGRRRLTIPSAMAYGARGAGGVIKPHEALVFVVDLLAVG